MDDTPEPLDDQPLSADDAIADAQVAALWYDLGYYGEADDDNV